MSHLMPVPPRPSEKEGVWVPLSLTKKNRRVIVSWHQKTNLWNVGFLSILVSDNMWNFLSEKIVIFNYKFQNQQSCETCLSRTLIQASRHSLQIAWFSSSDQMKLYSSSPQTDKRRKSAFWDFIWYCVKVFWCSGIFLIVYCVLKVWLSMFWRKRSFFLFGDWMINGARSLTKHIVTLLCLLLVTCFVFRSLFCPFTQVTN